ncbi:MAG: hypothetical protein AB1798_19305, partial [Spirochaetota bacterium]
IGENILVYANITPYSEDDDTIMLVAQGQVWISSKDNNSVKYLSTMKSLPVTPGEKILFLPLGVSKEAKDQPFTIELEIQVTPYQPQSQN